MGRDFFFSGEIVLIVGCIFLFMIILKWAGFKLSKVNDRRLSLFCFNFCGNILQGRVFYKH